MQWYYAVNGRQAGPVDDDCLKQLASKGDVSPSDLVWNAGMGESWALASTVSWLFDTVPPMQALPPGTGGATRNRELMQLARECLAGNWRICIGAVVVYNLIFMAAGAVPFLGSVATLIVAGPMTVGLCTFFLSIVRRRKGELSEIFNGFQSFGTALAAYLLMCIFIFLWSLLLIVPGIIASLAYSMTLFIVAEEPSIGPYDAIKRSRDMMRGKKWKLFCLHWRFFGWSLLAIFLTFGIGFLWLFPYMYATFAKFYDDLRS